MEEKGKWLENKHARYNITLFKMYTKTVNQRIFELNNKFMRKLTFPSVSESKKAF